jgi:putative ABC transport system permease protein
MIRLSLRGVAARKARGVMTALAIFFGVAMIVGTLMLTDTINKSFDDIFTNANKNVDVTVKPAKTLGSDPGSQAPAFSESLLAKVRAVDGVDKAAGSIFDPAISILNKKGKRIGPQGPPHFASGVLPPPFNPWTYTSGRAPRSGDEMGIDKFTAKEEGYHIGSVVKVAGRAPAKAYRISGIGRFGSDVPLGGASIALFTLPEAQRLTNNQGKLDEILATARAGVSPAQLKQSIRAVTPPTVTIRTGSETAKQESDDVKNGFSFLSTALLVFAGVALFVGGFLIFNTFSITVSQRTREFGMLRTIGASKRQLLAAVLLEAFVIGLIASLIGLAGGFAFVAMITGLFKAIGFELPTSGLVLTSKTVIVGVVVGLLSTMVASLMPALRATRVTPLEALREGGVKRPTGPRTRRTVIAFALVVLGWTAVAVGLLATSGVATAFELLGLGLVLIFVGVAMLGPQVVRPLASAVGWPIEVLRGVTGRLARENTLRNPGRTTTTAAALMIGLTLVTFVGVFAASLSKSFNQAIDRAFVGDVVLENTDGFSGVPVTASKAVARVPGVATVSPLATSDAKVAGIGGVQHVNAFNPRTLLQVAHVDWKKGSDATLATLGPHDAIVESRWAKNNDIAVGDTLAVRTPTDKNVRYTVRGSIRDKATLVLQTFAVPRSTLRRDFGVHDDEISLVSFRKGAPFATVRAAIDRVLERAFPNVESRSQKQLKDDQAKQVNQLLVLVYALLTLSIIVSLFGVVNTLILTIHERTREIGMLRAIGTARSQVRQMIRYESVITAMIGAILGAVIGLVLAVVAVKALADEGFILSIPVLLIAIMLVLASIAGVLAAIAPARRASRLNVIEALQYE